MVDAVLYARRTWGIGVGDDCVFFIEALVNADELFNSQLANRVGRYREASFGETSNGFF